MGYAHSPASGAKKKLALVFGLTLLYLIAEVVGGLRTRSLALLADAGHMLTDVAGLALALFAIRFAERPATPERTYGFYRVEILAEAIESVPGVASAHDLHVWTLTSGVNEMSAHAVLAGGASHEEALAAVRERITSEFKIAHVTVKVEPKGFAEEETHL